MQHCLYCIYSHETLQFHGHDPNSRLLVFQRNALLVDQISHKSHISIHIFHHKRRKNLQNKSEFSGKKIAQKFPWKIPGVKPYGATRAILELHCFSDISPNNSFMVSSFNILGEGHSPSSKSTFVLISRSDMFRLFSVQFFPVKFSPSRDWVSRPGIGLSPLNCFHLMHAKPMKNPDLKFREPRLTKIRNLRNLRKLSGVWVST